MRRRAFIGRLAAAAAGLAGGLAIPLQRAAERFPVWHRYPDGMRYVKDAVFRPYSLGPDKSGGWLGWVESASGNLLGFVDRAVRYVPWWDEAVQGLP
jgi:hypothetical protein